MKMMNEMEQREYELRDTLRKLNDICFAQQKEIEHYKQIVKCLETTLRTYRKVVGDINEKQCRTSDTL